MHKPSEGVEIENVTANFGTHAWHVMQQKLFRVRNKPPPSESFEGLVSSGLAKMKANTTQQNSQSETSGPFLQSISSSNFGLRNPWKSNGFSQQADGLWPREPSGAGRIGGRCRGLVQGARGNGSKLRGKKWRKHRCTICGNGLNLKTEFRHGSNMNQDERCNFLFEIVVGDETGKR